MTRNAFSLPGGPIYVNTGLIAAADNEAQLAGVLAHEMSHIALRHATNQASKANLIQLPALLLGALIAADAGYNPIEMARFFEKLEPQSGQQGAIAEFLSDHPNPGDRVAAVEEEVRQLPRRTYVADMKQFARIQALLAHVPDRETLSLPEASSDRGGTEVDALVTVQRRRGLYYMLFAAPTSQWKDVEPAYEQMMRSVRFR